LPGICTSIVTRSGRELFDERERGEAVFAFADHLDVAVALENRDERGPADLRVIDDEDAQLSLLLRCCRERSLNHQSAPVAGG